MLKSWTLGKSLLGIEFQKQMQQQTRQVRIRKPPWAGRAKNKLFRVPPLHIQDQTEKAFMRPIWSDYLTQMRSIYQLFKTEIKFSAKESLKVKEEKRILEAEEKRLYEENAVFNKTLLDEQLRDQEAELEAKKKRAETELMRKLDTERRLAELADQNVKKLKEQAKSFIDPKNLEMEIEKALNSRVSYNFSIDEKGNVYKS